MAIMNRCCCCDVRSGSMVVAIWTMLSMSGSLIANVRAWANMPDGYMQLYGTSLIAYYVISMIFQAGVLLGSVALFFGAIKNLKQLLIPYLVSQGLLLLVETVFIIILIVLVANGNVLFFNFLAIDLSESGLDIDTAIAAFRVAYGVVAGVYAVDVTIGLLCFFCVMSLYQQLRDGCPYGVHTTQVMSVQQPYATGFAPPTYDPSPTSVPAPQQQYYKC